MVLVRQRHTKRDTHMLMLYKKTIVIILFSMLQGSAPISQDVALHSCEKNPVSGRWQCVFDRMLVVHIKEDNDVHA